jgi:anti-sigma regulatory factor (Ser/Thr protein kinase)
MAEAILREVTLALPMAPDMELEASKTAAAIAESIRMSPDRIDEVRQALIEACINALEHSYVVDREARDLSGSRGRSGEAAHPGERP